MNNPVFKSFPIRFDEDFAEWLGFAFGSSISISIVCFALYVMHKSNDAMTMWQYGCWSFFVLSLIWIFLSESLSIILALIGSEAVTFIWHSTWWGYAIAPIGMLVFLLLSLFAGGFCGFCLSVAYRALIDGENKTPIIDYPMNQAKRIGWAIGRFGISDRMMPLWTLSILARFLSAGFLVYAFGAHPYSYYLTLRWVIFCTCIYTAILSIKEHGQWVIIFGALAFVFNPIWVISLSRGVWNVVDWVVAAFLMLSVLDCPIGFGNEFRRLRRDNLPVTSNYQPEIFDGERDSSDTTEDKSQSIDASNSTARLISLANAGDSMAEFQLGRLYDSASESSDESITKDDIKAALCYRKAASRGFELAQNTLGDLYREGRGVPQDYSLAARWYQKAAEQGFVPAQHNLAMLHANGKGVPLDYVQAIKLMVLAGLGRNPRWGSELSNIEKLATSEQVAEGHRLADLVVDSYNTNKIKLDCGIIVEIDALYMRQTYLGLMEGAPTDDINQDIINNYRKEIVKMWGAHNTHLIEPKISMRYGAPHLPDYAYAVSLTSYEPDMCMLYVIWFAQFADLADSRDLINHHIKLLDWTHLAEPVDP